MERILKFRKIVFRERLFLAIPLMMFLLAGCSTLQRTAEPTPLPVRAQAYAQALQDQDLPKAYSFFTPQYRRKTTLEEYISLGRPQYDDVSVVRIEDVTETRAKVVLQADVLVQGFNFVDSQMNFFWELIDGEWYYAPPSMDTIFDNLPQ